MTHGILCPLQDVAPERNGRLSVGSRDSSGGIELSVDVIVQVRTVNDDVGPVHRQDRVTARAPARRNATVREDWDHPRRRLKVPTGYGERLGLDRRTIAPFIGPESPVFDIEENTMDRPRNLRTEFSAVTPAPIGPTAT